MRLQSTNISHPSFSMSTTSTSTNTVKKNQSIFNIVSVLSRTSDCTTMTRSPDIWHRRSGYSIRMSNTGFKIYTIIVTNKRIALGCPKQIPTVPANTSMTTLYNVRTRIRVRSCNNSTSSAIAEFAVYSFPFSQSR